MSSNFVAEIPGKEFFNSHNCSPKLSRSGCTYLGLAMVPSSTTWQSVPTSSESGAVERTSVFFICAINFARRNFAEPLKFTWDQSSGRSDHVSGPYIARDLGKFLCIGQFPAKIKSANEAEYLAQRHALIAQAPGHARLHTITHDLGAPSSANAFGISLEPSTSASAWAQSQVRIHPPCRAVHSFRKPCDGLRLPPQRVLQGIVWLF